MPGWCSCTKGCSAQEPVSSAMLVTSDHKKTGGAPTSLPFERSEIKDHRVVAVVSELVLALLFVAKAEATRTEGGRRGSGLPPPRPPGRPGSDAGAQSDAPGTCGSVCGVSEAGGAQGGRNRPRTLPGVHPCERLSHQGDGHDRLSNPLPGCLASASLHVLTFTRAGGRGRVLPQAPM